VSDGQVSASEPLQTVIRNPRLIQSSLFANTEDPVLEELKALDLSRVSPPEALELLARWRRELGAK